MCVDVALQAPPDERLVQLVRPQQQRQRRECQVVSLIVDVTHGVESDRHEDDSADQIGLRGEAHSPTVPRGM